MGNDDDVAAPRQTLYVSHLNEKVRLDEVKNGLYHVFSQFGNVLEVVARRTNKLRGQAWVILDDIGAATRAKRELDGFKFFDRNIKVQFARHEADMIAKINGTYVPQRKRTSLEKDDDGSGSKQTKRKTAAQQVVGEEKTNEETAEKNKSRKRKAPEDDDNDDGESDGKQASVDDEGAARAKKQKTGASSTDVGSPHNVLFLQGLPEQADQKMLTLLFNQYDGFEEVRLVPGQPGIAFVQFGSVNQAGEALDVMQGFKISATDSLKISFASQSVQKQ
eukprot:TRINITY_DN85712_c0_g1_i1.p2 TRINITY_DN85712_c0_g1~~TRINITY_DN85712_c0_g1_i1.p2  ORF type:complete len:287 (-),score=156.99 TRINITY_DN85712_c0_g1_i1:31-861(-)